MILETIDINFLRDVIPVFVFSFLIGYVTDSLIAFVTIKSKRKIKLSGFRVHHNLFGYISILLGAFYHHTILIGFGLGIILGHKIRDGILLFAERIETEVNRNKVMIERKVRRLRVENKKQLERKINEIRKEYK